MFAVNPNADTVEGDACYQDLKSIPGDVDAVVIATRPGIAEDTMREVCRPGIRHVWMHRALGEGSVSDPATQYGRERGITVIDGVVRACSIPPLTRVTKQCASCSPSDFTRFEVFEMVSDRQEQGWVFVFLGADQDVYAEGEKAGVAATNRVSWEKSKAGSDKMWKDVAYSTASYRTNEELMRERDRDRFHEEDPQHK